MEGGRQTSTCSPITNTLVHATYSIQIYQNKCNITLSKTSCPFSNDVSNQKRQHLKSSSTQWYEKGAYSQNERGQNYNALPHSLNSQHNQQANGKEHTERRQNTGRASFTPGLRSWEMLCNLNTKFPFKTMYFLGVRGMTSSFIVYNYTTSGYTDLYSIYVLYIQYIHITI